MQKVRCVSKIQRCTIKV